jgi:hypothetical protein
MIHTDTCNAARPWQLTARVGGFFCQFINQENSSLLPRNTMIRKGFFTCPQFLGTNLWISLKRQRNMPARNEKLDLNSFRAAIFYYIFQLLMSFPLVMGRNPLPPFALPSAM